MLGPFYPVLSYISSPDEELLQIMALIWVDDEGGSTAAEIQALPMLPLTVMDGG